MAVSPSKIMFYVANPSEYGIAAGAAHIARIPRSNIVGNFFIAWQMIRSGKYLVIAVGGPANSALFKNP